MRTLPLLAAVAAVPLLLAARLDLPPQDPQATGHSRNIRGKPLK